MAEDVFLYEKQRKKEAKRNRRIKKSFRYNLFFVVDDTISVVGAYFLNIYENKIMMKL